MDKRSSDDDGNKYPVKLKRSSGWARKKETDRQKLKAIAHDKNQQKLNFEFIPRMRPSIEVALHFDTVPLITNNDSTQNSIVNMQPLISEPSCSNIIKQNENYNYSDTGIINISKDEMLDMKCSNNEFTQDLNVNIQPSISSSIEFDKSNIVDFGNDIVPNDSLHEDEVAQSSESDLDDNFLIDISSDSFKALSHNSSLAEKLRLSQIIPYSHTFSVNKESIFVQGVQTRYAYRAHKGEQAYTLDNRIQSSKAIDLYNLNKNVLEDIGLSLSNIVIIKALLAVANGKDFDLGTKSEALNIINNLLKFETILTAYVFQSLFVLSSTASSCLQSKKLNYTQGYKLLHNLKAKLIEGVNNFEIIFIRTTEFIEYLQTILEKIDGTNNIFWSSTFMKKRTRFKKKMSGELTADKRLVNEMKLFEVEVYKVVYNNALAKLSNRYMINEDLIQDAAFFDPRTFSKLKTPGFMFPEGSLSKIASMAKVDVLDIQRQLIEFAQNYEAIANIDASILYQDCNDEFFEEENENHTDIEDDLKCALSEKNRCKSCISCAFLYVYTLVTHTPNYNDLYTVYKVILSLAFTQVSFERSFSILKTIKTRLRLTLCNDKLEAFMFMNLERGMIVPHIIIDRLGATSTEMKRMLIG
ncbi:hypothetical protein QTP88_010492 [Uroleucon formosanum]